MTRLIMHAGTQKTGTTAIQAFARRRRRALRRRGLLYPTLAPHPERLGHPHHLLTRAVSEPVPGLDAAALRGIVAGWRAEAERREAAVLFSAETLYRRVLADDREGGWFARRERYLRRIAEIFEGFEIEPVLVFRQPDEFVRSAFQESVGGRDRGRWGGSFAAFRERLLTRRLRYARNAEMFERVFGSVRIMIFEDLAAGGALPQAFFGRLGYDVAEFDETVEIRRSVTAAETMVRLFLNNAARRRDERKVRALMRSEALQRMIALHLGPGPYGVWEGPEARADFVRRVAGEVEELRARRFPERAVLFPALGHGALHPPAPELPAPLRDFLLAHGL